MRVFGLIDYSVLRVKINELSEDPKYASKEIERLMYEAIKEQHPEDYDTFVESHRGELRIIKENLISEYNNKAHKRVSGLIG